MVTCKRRKLKFADYYVDTVIIYQSVRGIDAIRFQVGELGETMGTPQEDSTEEVVTFTEENQLVSLSGVTSYTGVKEIQLSSLDQQCIVVTEQLIQVQAKENAAIEKVTEQVTESNEEEREKHHPNTVLAAVLILLIVVIFLTCFCFCASRDLRKRLNEQYLTPEELETARAWQMGEEETSGVKKGRE